MEQPETATITVRGQPVAVDSTVQSTEGAAGEVAVGAAVEALVRTQAEALAGAEEAAQAQSGGLLPSLILMAAGREQQSV